MKHDKWHQAAPRLAVNQLR